jgi:hypothetical protein
VHWELQTIVVLWNVAGLLAEIMVGDDKKRPARRCLFGPVDQADADAFLEELSAHSEVQANEKWGFDFRAGLPLPGVHRYEWTPMAGAEHIPPADDSLLSHHVAARLSDAAALSHSSAMGSLCCEVDSHSASVSQNGACGSSSETIANHLPDTCQSSVVQESVETVEKK